MQVLMMIIQMLQRTAISYGKMFTLMGTIIEDGGKTLMSTIEVLKQSKYDHIRSHYMLGILNLIAALAEFKKATKALKEAVSENPEDFKDAVSFAHKMKTEIPASLAECFQEVEELMKASDVKINAKLPAFIRESGQYMELISTGRIDVDEKTFKELVLKDQGSHPEFLVKALAEAKDAIEVKGWAGHKTVTEDGAVQSYVLWADDFNFDDILPQGVTKVDEEKENTLLAKYVNTGGIVYRVPVFHRMTTEELADLRKDADAFYAKLEKEDESSKVSAQEVLNKFDETFKDGLK